MRLLYILIPLVCVYATDDAEYINVKSVKGGHRGGLYRQYNPGVKLPNFYSNGTHGYGGYGAQQNTTQAHRDYEIGVCYIEVPTISLVYNQAHVPQGNGSRPDLSRIRSCCKGYIRNIHNFKICDPVCSQECVNALCTAPDVCTCFPDHVMNVGGFCIPTCPIGCQNGHCSGGECLCKEGYTLDSESKYCLPSCRDGCGKIGNCTAPNTCECKKGYESTPTGNCKPICARCENGDCVAPNVCKCRQGYTINQQALCVPICPQDCAPNGKCIAPGKCEFPEIITTTPAISPPFQPSNQQNVPFYPGNQVFPGNQGYYPGNQGPVRNSTSGQIYPQQPGNQNYPGYPGYPGQPKDENKPYPEHTGQNPGQPGSYPGQRGAYPGQPGPYTGQPGSYPGQPGSYPGQPGSYPGQPGPYPGQPGPYPGQPEYGQPGKQDHTRQPQTGNQFNSVQSQPGSQRPTATQNHSYPPSSGLSGTQESTSLQIQRGQYGPGENQLYPDIQQYNQEFQPDCSPQCINGVCLEGNRCQCLPGYVLDKTDVSATRCIPHCAGGCHNGVCSAPNFCICNMGYYKDHSVKGRPQCVKRN